MTAYISLQDRAYTYLKQEVLSGSFEVGKFYSETQIAAQLGISRTPMRDALQKLAHEGFIDIIPSKGFTLHEITQQEVYSTFQIRCAIEGYSAMELAGSLSKAVGKRCLKKLTSLLEKQRQLAAEEHVDIVALAACDRDFHIELVSFVNNEWLSETFQGQLYRIQTLAQQSFEDRNRISDTIKEHQAILSAIGQRNPHEAYEAIQLHMRVLSQLITKRNYSSSASLS